MPVHRVALTDLEATVAKIEETERIVSTSPSGDGALIVVTETRRERAAGGKETRT